MLHHPAGFAVERDIVVMRRPLSARGIRSLSPCVCLSPDGTTLFLNLFGTTKTGSGFTAAITGPWRHGIL